MQATPMQAAQKWLRANLFSSTANGIVTLLLGGALLWLGWRFLDWGLLHAVWGRAGSAACQADGAGACWAVVAEKWRAMLFGIYPPAQQWRPAVAVLLFLALLGITAVPRCWRMRLLLPLWLITVPLCGWLMAGGLGLDAVPTAQWGGLPLTLMLAVFGTLLAYPLGILLALGRRSDLPFVRAVCSTYIELVRGVPLVSVLFMASLMFALFLPEGVNIDKLLRAQAALILFNAAYLAEIVRAGLAAVPRGQYDAAAALGLTWWQTQRLVTLPQALRVTIPAQVNSLIDNFKDTSLVIVVSIFDFLFAVKQAVVSDLEWRHFFVEGFLFAMAVYWLFCFAISRYSLWLEGRLRRAH